MQTQKEQYSYERASGFLALQHELRVSLPWFDRLTHYLDALGKVTRFVRDESGRVLYQTNANNELLSFTYYPDDELKTLTNGRNSQTLWNRNAYGLVTSKTLLANQGGSAQEVLEKGSNLHIVILVVICRPSPRQFRLSQRFAPDSIPAIAPLHSSVCPDSSATRCA